MTDEQPGMVHEESSLQCFPECAVRRVSACTYVPYKEGNSVHRRYEFNGGVAEDKVFA